MKRLLSMPLCLLALWGVRLAAKDCGNWTYQNLTESAGGAPSAVLGALASYAAGSVRHVFYADVYGHVFEMYNVGNEPNWHVQDLTAITGAPARDTEGYGNLTAYSSGASDSVVFVDYESHVQELRGTGGTWSVTDLTAAANSPLADLGSALSSYTVAGGEHVVFIDANRHVSEFHAIAGATPSWTWEDLSVSAGDGTLAGAPNLTSFVIGNSRHVVFSQVDGMKLVELYTSGRERTWHSNTVLSYPAGSKQQIDIGLSSFVSGSAGHVFYAEQWYASPNSEPIIEAYKTGSQWQAPNKATGMGLWGPVPAVGRFASFAIGPNEALLHVDAGGDVDLAYSYNAGQTWYNEDLTALSGAPKQTDTSFQPLSKYPLLTRYTAGSEEHSVYLDQNSNLVDVYYAPGTCFPDHP